MDNAGLEVATTTLDELSVSNDLTYDAKTRTVVNAYESGILDPVKVTRIALENSLSVASTILTSESVIFEEQKETNQQQMDMGY